MGRFSNGGWLASGTRPADGLIEAIPHAFAGLRSEPPMSLPKPRGLIPLAIAAASPPLLPDAVLDAFHGFFVNPCKVLSVCTRMARSGQFVLAIGMAPAARTLSTNGESCRATASLRAGTPHVLATPFRSMLHLMETGTPCSGPRGSPLATARSAASAAASASSRRTWTTALSFGLTAEMRSRCACTTSREDTRRAAMALANCPADCFQSSVIWVLAG
ncbi:Uncharacterised protein [Delftia tsuruhatensis]|nr:Uncharacterised protein [Delftia tsuruhatensis]CAC9675826.1 Uncharacterised protein [Delftia tsuruhatensis]